MKSFCTSALAGGGGGGGAGNRRARPRGILLLGVPGTGKSAFARALGNETGRPTLVLDVGSLMGGLVGSTEQNTRTALRAVDAMAPCVCWLDGRRAAGALTGLNPCSAADAGRGAPPPPPPTTAAALF